MINLVSKKVKKVTRIEYWARVSTVWGILLSLVTVSIGALFVPTFVLLNLRLNALEIRLTQMYDDQVVINDVESVIKAANTITTQLQKRSRAPLFSELLTELQSAKVPGVSINTFSMTQDTQKIQSVQIQGVAASRDALASFRTTLEASPYFETAFVPISGLARESDLPFNISITMADLLRE